MANKCFSFTASRDWCYRYAFASTGLRSATTDLGDGTVVHCWVPKTHKQNKPTLLLLHGFGANAMWQWGDILRSFVSRFNIYVPDLLFFGDSFTTRPERSESFQAQCMMRMMAAHGVQKMILIGLSYGGFVGYGMAAQFPEAVEKVVICCSGVCLEEKDMSEGLFIVSNLDDVFSVLLPQTPEKLRELMRLSFVKPAKIVPSCFLRDFIDVMCTEYVEEKKELIHALLKDRKLSDLPKISQPTLIIWGEQDQVFPLVLGHRLKSYLGENAQLVVIKNAGHAVNFEKPKEIYKHLKPFLFDSPPPSPPSQHPPSKFLENKVD
ncbi:PREDICTED: uncharacterized protein LOC104606003 [Nelumbo nucifera]|uniref:Uncharacterized protein LOC104606003 n=1 Tax=Nelumbo nucifera TaxID=4432 RepID=A0A1U8B0G0_NELNU|nr:PREDICTED: uncharacterized protein LOC104606003 [Nelumbo nucifera]